jgi:hypothetical protein
LTASATPDNTDFVTLIRARSEYNGPSADFRVTEDFSVQIDCQAWLQSLNEAQLRGVLEELLRVMGYQRVSNVHSPIETGKDLVFFENDRIGRPIWRAIQAKAEEPLSGSLTGPKGLRTVLQQCEAALDSDYTDSNGNTISLAEVWLVTPFPISDYAKLNAKGKLRNLQRVHIIDGPPLAELVQKHLPSLAQSDASPIDAYFDYLLEFCDSPDAYLTERMRVRFSFAKVYVPSIASIQVLTASSDTTIGPLRPLLDPLGGRLSRNMRLYGRRMLPAYDYLQLLDDVNFCSRLMRGCLAIEALREHGRLLRPLVASLPTGPSRKYVESLETFEQRQNVTKPFTAGLTKSFLTSTLVDMGALAVSDRIQLAEYINDDHSIKSSYIAELLDEVNTAESQYPRVRLRLLLRILCDALAESSPGSVAFSAWAFSDIVDKIEPALRHSIVEYGSHLDACLSNCNYVRSAPPADLFRWLAQLSLISDLLLFLGCGAQPTKNIDINAFHLGANVSRLLVIGPLGIGKTTLLKQLCVASVGASRLQHKSHLPIFSVLSTVRDYDSRPIHDALVGSAKTGFVGIERYPANEIHWALDGFDEIESNELREKVLDWCSEPDGPAPRIVMSSRPTAFDVYIPGYVRATVLPFSWAQINQYIEQFPWSHPEKANKLIQVLRTNEELGALAQTPLLLTLIAILTTRFDPERLPSRRDEIYDLVTKLLLSEWDSAKGLRRTYSIEEGPTRAAVIEKTAYTLYSMHRTAFGKREFAELCASSISPGGLQRDDMYALVDELVRDCVLIPVSKDIYKFFHLSLHEYLAGRDLCRDISPERVDSAIVEYFRTDGDWWEEVLVFYAGIKRDIGVLIGQRLYNDLSGNSHTLLVRLLRRWKTTADLTDLERVGVKGLSVQRALDDVGWRYQIARVF